MELLPENLFPTNDQLTFLPDQKPPLTDLLLCPIERDGCYLQDRAALSIFWVHLKNKFSQLLSPDVPSSMSTPQCTSKLQPLWDFPSFNSHTLYKNGTMPPTSHPATEEVGSIYFRWAIFCTSGKIFQIRRVVGPRHRLVLYHSFPWTSNSLLTYSVESLHWPALCPRK